MWRCFGGGGAIGGTDNWHALLHSQQITATANVTGPDTDTDTDTPRAIALWTATYTRIPPQLPDDAG